MPLPTIDETADFAFPLFRESAQVARIVARDDRATLPTQLGAGRLMSTNGTAFTRTMIALRAQQNAQNGPTRPTGQTRQINPDIARELDAAAGIQPRQGRRRRRRNRQG